MVPNRRVETILELMIGAALSALEFLMLRSTGVIVVALAGCAPLFASATLSQVLGAEADRAPKPANIVTRDEWGSKPDPIPDSRRHTPRWITIHHAGVLWTNSQDPAQFVRNMQSWGKKRPQVEQPPRNTYWPDLPYHFLIAPDGRIFEGRPVEFEPESNTKYELAGNVNVELMGDFNRQRPSPAQLESLVRLTAYLMGELDIAIKDVRTHRDAAPGQTECPGRDLLRYMDDGQFRRWTAAVVRGREPKIDPGPPLAGPPSGPTELITDTRPEK